MSAQKAAVDHYAVLGVSAESTFGEIQKAFFRLSLACHPDKRDKSEFAKAHDEYVLISAAYNVLKDPEARREYDSKRARRMQGPTAAQRGHPDGQGPWFHRENNEEDDFEPQGSQFPGNPRFYADKEERDAQSHRSARRANRQHPKQWETGSDPDSPADTREEEKHEPYEAPRHSDDEQTSPEQEAWLRFRTTTNSVQGLSFSLPDALHMVLEIIRALRKADVVKPQAAKARVQLRLIEVSFSSIQMEMGSVPSPICLTEATVSRVKKMMLLEESIREFVAMHEARPPAAGSDLPEQEATATGKLLLKAMDKWVQLLGGT